MFKSLLSDFSHASMSFGWKLRECQKLGPHWVQFAFAPFFLFQSAIIFRLIGDFYGYSESIDHMVYWFKMLSLGMQRVALALAKYALSTLRQHRPEKRASALRALISVHVSMGSYRSALELIDEYIEVQENHLDRADMMTHKAVCLQKLGHVRLGLYNVNEAIAVLEAVLMEKRRYVWAVWYTKALMVKAQILFEQCNVRVAKEFVELALEYAKQYDVHIRIREAEDWLDAMEQIKT